MTTVRPATDTDLGRVAELHVERIAEGFLSSLGVGFVRRLYRRVLRSADGFVLVAGPAGGVQGFVAGVGDVGALYRRFLVRDGVAAGLAAAPRLVRAVPRVIETLRYPDTTGDLPDAEILAVAVAASATGAGMGRALVRAGVARFTDLDVAAAKVVTTADNAAAIAMYEASGFVPAAPIEVHAGRASEVLVWRRS